MQSTKRITVSTNGRKKLPESTFRDDRRAEEVRQTQNNEKRRTTKGERGLPTQAEPTLANRALRSVFLGGASPGNKRTSPQEDKAKKKKETDVVGLEAGNARSSFPPPLHLRKRKEARLLILPKPDEPPFTFVGIPLWWLRGKKSLKGEEEKKEKGHYGVERVSSSSILLLVFNCPDRVSLD